MNQAPDTAPGAYYVSVMRDRGDYRLLAGPFIDDHAAALAKVDQVRGIAEDLDPKACWYSFGTCRLDINPDKAPPAGILNKHLNLN